MKKYLLPLILILFLTFVLIGNCDWLSGYDQRIKLTIDNTKIDSALSDFPVTVFFTPTQAEEIFTEFDADSDYMKCAFTSSNGTTQLYAEKELFDHSASKAIYHVKVTSVASGADTDIYYYYDNDHADNTDYVGAINTTAGATVWDGNFKAVYHMVDATTSTVLDSTSNNNDGTKKGANEPIEATGRVGLGQDFDGSNDYIDLANDLILGENATIEAIIKPDAIETTHIISHHGMTGNRGWYFIIFDDTTDEELAFINSDNGTNLLATFSTNANMAIETYYHVVMVKVDTAVTFYKAGNPLTDDGTAIYSTTHDSSSPTELGAYNSGESGHYNGIEDEVRYSETNRSAAWIKATYNSLWDTLLTYGSEETEEAEEANAIFFGMNF